MGKRKYTDQELLAWEDKLVGSILEIVERADDQVVKAGRGWYDVGHAEVQILAREYEASVFRAAAVVSVLSPLSQWAGNLSDAWAAFAGEPMVHSLPTPL